MLNLFTHDLSAGDWTTFGIYIFTKKCLFFAVLMHVERDPCRRLSNSPEMRICCLGSISEGFVQHAIIQLDLYEIFKAMPWKKTPFNEISRHLFLN